MLFLRAHCCSILFHSKWINVNLASPCTALVPSFYHLILCVLGGWCASKEDNALGRQSGEQTNIGCARGKAENIEDSLIFHPVQMYR